MGFRVLNTVLVAGMNFGEDLLKPLGATLVSGNWNTEDDLIANGKDADGIICAGPSQPWTRRVITTLSRCRIISTLSIGYDKIHVETATQMGIAVTNLPDYCIDEVSSQAIAFVMGLGRKLVQVDKAVRERQPRLSPPSRESVKEILYPMFRMRGQTLGIIGFGKIGTTVALKARGLGLRVIAYDPYVLGAVMLSHGVEPKDLDALLRESDFVSINALLTDETRGMIGPEQFKKMKPTCYVINTARGEIIQESALIEALKQGLIAGAGLDVTSREPIPQDDPILNFPNVILSGHSAWYSTTSDSDNELWQKPMTQVIMALQGKWPTYAVNPEGKQAWLERWGRK